MAQFAEVSKENASILNAKTDAMVNPVNCTGVMGAGLALEFKKAFPWNFAAYQYQCRIKALRPGEPFLFFEEHKVASMQLIVNFPTKDHWRDKSNIDYIESGLDNLKRRLEVLPVCSIAFPLLGCGLGGLNEKEVIELIKASFKETDLWVDIYI